MDRIEWNRIENRKQQLVYAENSSFLPNEYADRANVTDNNGSMPITNVDVEGLSESI